MENFKLTEKEKGKEYILTRIDGKDLEDPKNLLNAAYKLIVQLGYDSSNSTHPKKLFIKEFSRHELCLSTEKGMEI